MLMACVFENWSIAYLSINCWKGNHAFKAITELLINTRSFPIKHPVNDSAAKCFNKSRARDLNSTDL